MQRRLIIHGPTVLWGITILVLTSIPTLAPPDLGVDFSDKVAHAGVYAVFAFFLIRSFRNALSTKNRVISITLISAIAFGALDEFHQRFIPGRYAELMDFAADVFGIVVVVTGYFIWKRYRKTDA